MRTEKVHVWLDAGTFDAMLSTNRYLLEHGHDNTEKAAQRIGVRIIPPVYIHPEAEVEAFCVGTKYYSGSRMQDPGMCYSEFNH